MSTVPADIKAENAALADWIIDMGPGAGDAGGNIVAAGTPHAIAANPASKTGAYLAPLLR
jgi:excinuclease ABC subunit A